MDLTPLITTLRSALGYETIKPAKDDLALPDTARQIRLLGRVPQSRMGDWLIFIHHIHVSWIEARRSPWTVDISKLYITHPVDKRVVFAWRVILQPNAPDLPMLQHLDDIIRAVRSSPQSSRSDVMSIPLVGSRAGVPIGPDGKGAGLTDKVPTGAALHHMRRS